VRPKAEVLPKAVAGSPRVGQMFTSTGVLASSGRSSKDVMRGSGLPLQGPSRPRTLRLAPHANGDRHEQSQAGNKHEGTQGADQGIGEAGQVR
jgi:hypothetical protein